MRYLLIFVLLTAVAAAAASDVRHVEIGEADRRIDQGRSQRPNIIFIFTDDHAAHAIGAYGGWLANHAPTPNIDRLARQGMLFRNCFCTNSICGPSRAVILTGKHSHINGFRQNGDKFDGSQPTFPKLLQQRGYQTAMIGKWHLGTTPTGFDYWVTLPGQGSYYNPDFNTPDGKVRIEGHCTDIVTDLALEWIDEEREGGRPFVLMCQHKAPHRTWMPALQDLQMFTDAALPEPPTLFDDYTGRAPAASQQEMTIRDHLYLYYDLKLVPDAQQRAHLAGPDRWWEGGLNRMNKAQRAAWDRAFAEENAAFEANPPTGDDLVRWKYQRYIKNYLRCIAGVDRSVGRIMDHVANDAELAGNTIIVYSSDQGFYLGDHGWYDKRWMYEESLRMPLIVRWPGVTRAGSESTALVQNLDFAPTFLDAAGIEQPADMQGRSLIPLLKREVEDEAAFREAVYYRYFEYPAVHMVAKHYGIRTDRYKLIHYDETGDWELFDLAADPDELRSVYADPAYADILRDLKWRLAEAQARYADTPG